MKIICKRARQPLAIELFSLEEKHDIILLYPPQRRYISFVKTFATPRNNDLGPMELCSLETFDQRKILRHLSYVCLSVRQSAYGPNTKLQT